MLLMWLTINIDANTLTGIIISSGIWCRIASDPLLDEWAKEAKKNRKINKILEAGWLLRDMILVTISGVSQ